MRHARVQFETTKNHLGKQITLKTGSGNSQTICGRTDDAAMDAMVGVRGLAGAKGLSLAQMGQRGFGYGPASYVSSGSKLTDVDTLFDRTPQ